MSILFLNILTLLADNLFHSFAVLCENENFLISCLHCFFANVTPCPLVLLSSLTVKKIFLSIFSYPFNILNTSIWSLNLWFLVMSNGSLQEATYGLKPRSVGSLDGMSVSLYISKFTLVSRGGTVMLASSILSYASTALSAILCRWTRIIYLT